MGRAGTPLGKEVTVRGMKPLLFGALGLLAIASAASAVSLSVSPDKLTYSVGETITLTVSGDDAGVTAYGIHGRLIYDGALVNNGTRTQNRAGPVGVWTVGPLAAADTNGPGSFSDAMNQSTPSMTDAANYPGVVSVVTLIAQAVGIVDVQWNATDPNQLFFFGITSAPGTSFTIVPEPTTAALLVLGLLALSPLSLRGTR